MNVTISVFFSGTGHRIDDSSTLASLLYQHIDQDSQKAVGFNGCGITHGFMGGIFGVGLDEHCQEVIHQVLAEIKKGNTVTLNAYGHSRGAINAIMLAQQLASIDPEVLDINLALHDPVPGNLITTATLDVLNGSLANKTMDLRACKPLKKVLALYPHKPLPALAAHAPLMCLYPEHTEVDEDVIAGCHSNAQFHYIVNGEVHFQRASFISFARVLEFFRECGSLFKPFWPLKRGSLFLNGGASKELNQALLLDYPNEMEDLDIAREESKRECHSALGVSINTKNTGAYYNLHHQRLLGIPEDKNQVRVSIQESKGFFAILNRSFHRHPIVWQSLKWSFLGIGFTCLIFFTAGMGAIPLLAQLGTALSLLILTPIIAGMSAGLWYGILKPVTEWIVNKILYPKFQLRPMPTEIEQPIKGSAASLNRLGGAIPSEPEVKPSAVAQKDLSPLFDPGLRVCTDDAFLDDAFLEQFSPKFEY